MCTKRCRNVAAAALTPALFRHSPSPLWRCRSGPAGPLIRLVSSRHAAHIGDRRAWSCSLSLMRTGQALHDTAGPCTAAASKAWSDAMYVKSILNHAVTAACKAGHRCQHAAGCRGRPNPAFSINSTDSSTGLRFSDLYVGPRKVGRHSCSAADMLRAAGPRLSVGRRGVLLRHEQVISGRLLHASTSLPRSSTYSTCSHVVGERCSCVERCPARTPACLLPLLAAKLC